MNIDTSKMTAAEYAAFTGAKSYPAGLANVAACPLESAEPPKPSCRPGQCPECGYRYLLSEEYPNNPPLMVGDSFVCLGCKKHVRAIDAMCPLPPKTKGESSMSEPSQFAPGQRVYSTSGGMPFVVIAQDKGDVWGRWDANGSRELVPAHWLTATDPYAKSLPQAQDCPFCGTKAIVHEYMNGEIHAYCSSGSIGSGDMPCCLIGPASTSREEAIAAWNSLRVVAKTATTAENKEQP